MRSKAITIGIVVCVVAVVAGGLAIAQPPGFGGRRPGQGPGAFNPERMRQMMSQRLQEQLGASDAEWQVMGPRVLKVMDLNRQSSGAGGMGRMFMRGFRDRRGDDQERPGQGDRRRPERPQRPGGDREVSAVEKAAEQLMTALENESASSEDIKKQLTTLRAEREKARQELAKAQQELRQICTLRQEAQLVLMGLLN
jgi:hypothetical protein